MRQLRTSTNAARADAGFSSQFGEQTPDGRGRHLLGILAKHERISRVLPREHGANLKTLWKHHRQVLAAVDGEIRLAREERLLDFLHEQPLATNLGQGCFGEAISRRLDGDDFGCHAAPFTQSGSDRARLEQRELAAASCDSKRSHEALLRFRVRARRI